MCESWTHLKLVKHDRFCHDKVSVCFVCMSEKDRDISEVIKTIRIPHCSQHFKADAQKVTFTVY